MIDGIHIRLANERDFPGWKILWEGYNAFYGRSGPTALPDEITRLTWSRFLDPSEPMHALVAERTEGLDLLGIAHFLYHRSTIQVNSTCYLQDLFTVTAARGNGVGRALIRSVCERAKSAGSSRVYWQTHETNAVALQLYDKVAEKSGFIVYRKML